MLFCFLLSLLLNFSFFFDLNFLLRVLQSPFPYSGQSGRKLGKPEEDDEIGFYINNGVGNTVVGFAVISTSVGEEDTVGTKDILGTKDVVGVSVIELLGAVDEDGGSLGAKDMLGDNVFVL